VSGNLNKNIIRSFRTQFEGNCVQLLLESHKELLKNGVNFKESDENTITVQLIGYMNKNPVSADYKIDITREQYIDSSAVYAGLEDPNASPRIDIRFMTWTSPEKFEYFFEAKNLYESDFTKSGNKTAVNSKSYQQRYINTGIQNFINGRYPQGCLVGYVLEGNPENIADKINDLLKSASRNVECLKKINAEGKIQFCYESTHTGKHLSSLTHYFLNLT
jgi:hypothetical protein